jgi:hypothetical protein
MKTFFAFPLIQLLLLLRPNNGLQQAKVSHEPPSRRQALATICKGAVVLPLSTLGSPAEATELTADRDQLLHAIARKASDEEIIKLIGNLKDPSGGKGAILPEWLDGEWELVWSYKAEAFSPLLKLPKPLRPDSYQYFGKAATSEVGEGRISQGLTGGILGRKQFWLSSGAIPLESDPSILEIQPPFRFQVGGRYGTGEPKKTVVEAGSDAEFRKVNARTQEEQLAGKNQYQQMYLENNGPGSLRVSGVIAGDPVIVGLLFVHRKI